MYKINEDLKVNGAVFAQLLDGPLSEETAKPFVDTDDVLRSDITAITVKLNNVLERLETLTQSYNNAIQVINDLSERVAALEANYDPTVIK